MEKEKVRLGTVAFTPKGKWDAETEYKRLNVVHFLASSYYAKQDNVGQTPSLDSEYWGLLVEGGDVTNNPDEEDITEVVENDAHVLKLADRDYNPDNFSGKGHKILRKNVKNIDLAVTKVTVNSVPTADGEISITINNVDSHITLSKDTHNTTALAATAISEALATDHEDYDVVAEENVITLIRKHSGTVEASAYDVNSTGVTLTIEDSICTVKRNVLTSTMMSQSDTIYEIRYDFDLDGGTLKIPENSILRFNGGCIKNGTINGDNTIIEGNARLFTESSGTFLGTTHVTWFLQKRTTKGDYDAREDVMRALQLSTLTKSRILDFDREPIYVKGSLNLSESRQGTLINANITYEPKAALESLFECDSNRIWNGGLSIRNSYFSCKNPSKLQGVNVIHFHRWYNTGGWYFKTINFSGFTGYFLVNESYLQEGSFDNVSGNGDAFISFNCFGVFGERKGSSNILTFKDCNTNNGDNTIDTTIVPYKLDLYNYGNIKFINCVFQGHTPKDLGALYLSGNTSFSVANHIVMDTFWNESQGTEALDIDFGTAIEFKGQAKFNKININADRVCLDLKNCQVTHLSDFIDSINIKEGVTQVSINMDGYLMHSADSKLTGLLDSGAMTIYKNNGSPWRENFNSNQIVGLDKTVDGLIGLLQTSYYLNLRYNYRCIDVNGIPCIEVYYDKNVTWGDVQFPTSFNKRDGIIQYSAAYFVYRMAPQVDVTEDNVDDVFVNISSTTNWGDSKNYKFDVGAKANEFTAWKKAVMLNYDDGTGNHCSITPQNAIIQIAAFRVAQNVGILEDTIVISADGNTISRRNARVLILSLPISSWSDRYKKIIKSEKFLYKLTNGNIYSYNATTDQYVNLMNTNSSGNTASRPTVGLSAGYEYFDTTLKKPIWWTDSAWVDEDGNPADAKRQGTTAERPTGVKVGYIYKDTTLNKLIIWNGGAWVNMDGSSLDTATQSDETPKEVADDSTFVNEGDTAVVNEEDATETENEITEDPT